MVFSKAKIVASVLLASSALWLGACSKSDNSQKETSITATTPVSGEASTLIEEKNLQRLQTTLEGYLKKVGITAKILSIRPTEVPNLYWVSLEGVPSVFVTGDGKYVFQGDVARLGGDKVYSISDDLNAKDNKSRLEKLDLKDLIIYPAQNGTAKYVIYVFTDASCPYCHKLHEHMAELNAKGIEVRYLAWPRGPQFYATMQNIWCSQDRKAAMDKAIKNEDIPTLTCQNPIEAQFQLGQTMGVQGTPAVYSQNGKYLSGYAEPAQLLKLLQEQEVSTTQASTNTK